METMLNATDQSVERLAKGIYAAIQMTGSIEPTAVELQQMRQEILVADDELCNLIERRLSILAGPHMILKPQLEAPHNRNHAPYFCTDVAYCDPEGHLLIFPNYAEALKAMGEEDIGVPVPLPLIDDQNRDHLKRRKERRDIVEDARNVLVKIAEQVPKDPIKRDDNQPSEPSHRGVIFNYINLLNHLLKQLY